MDDNQHQRNLEHAKQLVQSAEARLRFYAYVEGSPDHELEHAKSDWERAETLLWDTIQDREQVAEFMAAFANAADAMALLMDVLATGVELLEDGDER